VQLGRAFFLLVGTACNFAALSHLPLTVTTSIFFATPVLVSLLAVPILGETIGLRRFLAILVGFGGVLIITEPWGAAFHWAMLFSLASLFCASMYFVLTRMIAGVDDNPTGQMITSGIPAVALAPFVVAGWVWPPDVVAWAPAVAIGLLGVGGHTLITVGYRYAPAPTLAPAVYSQILYAALISWAVFSQPPDTRTLLGAAVIVGAGLYIWLRERALRRGTSLPLRAGR
jgi:drug/metabolite transporter (DMT)-like permease